MSNFIIPRFRATDANGSPIVGAKLYFYMTETTTPLATYSDEGLTISNTNPVVSDGSGYFGAIYLQDAAYTVLYTDEDDVTIWTVDNFRGAILNSSNMDTRIEQIASNPLTHGAIGDGANDEANEVQAAINAATGVVDLLGKTYRCGSALALKSGITIRNGTLVFDDADELGLYSSGTVHAPKLLTSDCDGYSVVLSSVSGFSVGDMVLITRPGSFCEVNSVVSIDVGTLTLGLSHSLQGEYTTADLSSCSRIAPLENIRLEKLSITGPDSALPLINIDAARNISVHNCTMTKPQYNVMAVRSQDIEFTECRFSNCESGVRARRGCDGVRFISCKFRGSGGGNAIYIGEDEIATGLLNGEQNTIVRDCTFENFAYGVITGELSRRLTIESCMFDKVSTMPVCGAFNSLTSQYVSVRGCHVICGETSSIEVSANYGEYIIDGITVVPETGASSGCDISATVSTAGTIRIVNNRIGGQVSEFGDITANGPVVTVIGNMCNDITALGSVALVKEHNIELADIP